MIFLVGILFIPLLVAIGGFLFTDRVSWKELLVQISAQILIAGVCGGVAYYSNVADTEVWTGVVTKKSRDWTSCSHSYPCNCHQVCSGSGKSQSCSTVCDTCYEHSNDWNWDVYVSTGDVVTIDRVDRQGVYEPARFSKVIIGEPAAVPHLYVNYIKGSPDTLFRHQGLVEKYEGSFPAYPGEVYDYYRIDRHVAVNVVSPDKFQIWNTALMRLNADVGASKQANVAVVQVYGKSHDWFLALEEKWIGGKKNDVVVVYGLEMGTGAIEWVDIMAWSVDPIFKVKLRDALMENPTRTPAPKTDIPKIREAVVKDFQRKPMKDFAYLKSVIKPTTTEWVVSLIVGVIVALGLTWLFYEKDVFGDERGYGASPSFRRARRREMFKEFPNPFKRIKKLFSSRPWEDA